MRIFISTGEVSGDLQGALLIKALKEEAQVQGIKLEITALGGGKMAAAGAVLLGNTSEIGSVGLFESFPFVLPTWKIQRRAKQYLREYPPDLVVLIDYLGPNLGIGSFVRSKLPGVPIIYYIAPQTWVWSPLKANLRQLVKITDHLLAIFSEEADFFANLGVKVTWVGHPLLDRMKDAPDRFSARQMLGIDPETTVITLVPASRRQELRYILPVMAQAAQQLQQQLPGQVEYLIPLSLPIYRLELSEAIAAWGLKARIIEGQTLEAIAAADLAIAKSGTVNLEIALLEVPQVVIYRINPLTMAIARRLFAFSIAFMSPPNLVCRREIVPELLQEEATAAAIVAESMDLLTNQDRREQLQRDYQELRKALGVEGICRRAARIIIEVGLETRGAIDGKLG